MRASTWRWLLSLAGVSALALVAWLLGPLLPTLEPAATRAAIAGLLLILWLAANLLADWQARRRARALAGGLAAPGTEEADAVRGTLAAAIASQGKAGLLGKPWYAIIGPPGAGKTTALLNAGLTFPASLGAGPVAGVGGTRLCDWWFTDQAVLIDTAGRYTTQDSAAAVDAAGWSAFLDLLRRSRPAQPLNGLIVALSLAEIADAPAEERAAHATAVRARLDEMRQRLGLDLPVYVWLTKADLIAGFAEHFAGLDRAGRDQVWGVTLPAGVRDPAAISTEWRHLAERLQQGTAALLQAEPNPDRRALIAGFPLQLATLEEPLARFLAACFAPIGSAAPMLRGVYLTSATQEGTPIDRLLGTMARTFGISQRRADTAMAGSGRSFFLHGLLTGVILNEAMLAGTRPQVRRRRARLRLAGFATMAATAVAACALLFATTMGEQARLRAAATRLDQYQAATAGYPFDPVADSDLPGLVPVLDAARAVAGEGSAGISIPGLTQRDTVAAGARTLYRHALEHALLPRLLWRLEAQMRGNLGEPAFLYQATRIYLMLGGQGPMDTGLVREWMALDWRSTYPGALNAPLVAGLTRHLDALLAQPLPPVSLDGQLVEAARATFGRVSLAERVYSRIKPSAAALRAPPWQPSDALGPLGLALFVRASGKPLSEGIPGFYTAAGFHSVLLPGLASAAREVASESWVLGQATTAPDAAALQALDQAVIALYVAEYEAAWDAMLADVQPVPLQSLTQAAQNLYILTSPQSPLRTLLTSAAAQLALAGEDDAPPAADSALASLVATADARTATDALPGAAVDAHYRPLRQLVLRDHGAGLDRTLQTLTDLQQLLAKMAAAPIGAAAPTIALGADPAVALRSQAQSLPQPLGRWMSAMADQGALLRTGTPRQQVAAVYNGAGGPAALCQNVVNGRFPFVANSTLDSPIADFATLFAPGGIMDGFVNTELAAYLNRSASLWAPQDANGGPAPFSAADAAQFQRAAVIRDLFFAAGSTTPALQFDLAPLSLDPATRQATLDFGTVAVLAARGAAAGSGATQIGWPGPTGMQTVRLAFDPPPEGGTGVLAADGPWALFRLMDQAEITEAGADGAYRVAFHAGDRLAVFALHSGAALSPLVPALLQAFRCPAVHG